MLPGPYRVGAYRMVGRIRLTSKTPCGPTVLRGRSKARSVRERLMDAVAARLKIDPIVFRRRNLMIAQIPISRADGEQQVGPADTFDLG